ncbi:DUF2922 domain-containing protein [Apilactobacillus xinyiensis]|uniref:DUF2922 domain-containing protein n=1 Tax=Apilactobacillus xinyiensis TaxID=2841032 RepID=A0ABT0I369_9LACO|nr:DUF2922 domain-containing protein [Apilactobacillus xinyiensis]MCK8625182.1 DUF2922 domain-containing protein [Apilactobacillus xinyiensis]MCL0318923.1 DUF2922 domain-containing protein [Apilactobacillus xinyiensis]MCL0330359.1 DUF2922 domain-containing protein [Apilactobacillus xinyiensis]
MKHLELTFQTEDRKIKTLKLNYASEALGLNEVQGAMNRIAALNMFQHGGINLYKVPVAAKYVDTNTETIFDTRNK